jgi:hypothetical protein
MELRFRIWPGNSILRSVSSSPAYTREREGTDLAEPATSMSLAHAAVSGKCIPKIKAI